VSVIPNMYGLSTKMTEVEHPLLYWISPQWLQVARFLSVS